MKSKNEIYPAQEFNNIREIIKNAVEKYPFHNAFIIKNKPGTNQKYTEITYRQMDEEIDALGTSLVKRGLKGKRIAVISPNRYEWVVSYLATVNGTGIVIPLDKGLPEQEIQSLLERSKTDAVIFDKKYQDIMKKIQEEKEGRIRHFICMDETEEFTSLQELIQEGKELLRKGDTQFIEAEINNEEMSILLFTSGTTSQSKAVMLSHRNIASNIYALTMAEKIYDTDVNLAFLPLHHTFGSTGMLFFLSAGATNTFCDGIRHIQTNLKEYKVSVFVCVPLLLEAMYKKIMKEIERQGKSKLIKIVIPISNFLLKFGIDIRRKLFKDVINQLGGNIRFVVSGASAIDKKVAKGFNDFGILTVQGYGLTETSPVLIAENEKCIRYGSIGYPFANVDIKIDNPNQEGIGEIVASGPNVMLGYYENEEATKEVIETDENGKRWFHTGDLAYQDKDGYIYIAGRKKNVIVLKNGKNIYPEELELLINNLPYVEESMVFGMPKEEDLVVSAKIVYNKEYKEESNLSEEELKKKIWEDVKEINKGLPNYQHMKNIIVTDEPMIKTTTAKVKRFEEIEKIIKETNIM